MAVQESTESAAMLSSSSREGAQGTTIYTYDYKVRHAPVISHLCRSLCDTSTKMILDCIEAFFPLQLSHTCCACADRHYEREETHSVYSGHKE